MTNSLSLIESAPTTSHHPIIVFQTPSTRALTVGYIKKTDTAETFIPCRLNLGATREDDTFAATVESLKLPQVQTLLKKYAPTEISTVTLLRETIACHLSLALGRVGIPVHYGDCFIGANHVKDGNSITTSYAYENVEGLNPEGLWIVADSIAAGRNLIATMDSLLSKFHPKELLFIVPIGNRYGINLLSAAIAKYNIPTTFVVWGALMGLNPVNKYDEPWGLPDCEPVDTRDQKTFINMYAKDLCVGGDFGNDYYCPSLAMKLYEAQLAELSITPKIPSVDEILQTYTREDLVEREEKG